MPRPEAFLAYKKRQIIRFNLGSNYMQKMPNKCTVKKLMLLIERVYWCFLVGKTFTKNSCSTTELHWLSGLAGYVATESLGQAAVERMFRSIGGQV